MYTARKVKALKATAFKALAERKGFEPLERYKRSHDFQTVYGKNHPSASEAIADHSNSSWNIVSA